MSTQHHPDRRLDRRRRRPIRDLQINHFVLQPFFEPRDALAQVAAGFVARVLDAEDVERRERVGEEGAEVGGKGAEGVVAAFEAVDEDEEEGFAWHGWE